MATEYQTLDNIEMPKNFTWVIDNLLCSCGLPVKPEHLRFLRNQGVTCIVSLTAEHELPENAAKDFRLVRIKMADFTPPTLDQILQFVDVMEWAERNNERVAVHCVAGHGRTGTLVACYLVNRFRLTAHQAIQLLRRLRPGSVETKTQEDMVSTYQASLDPLWSQPAHPGHPAATGSEGQHQYQSLVNQVAPQGQGRNNPSFQASQLTQCAADCNQNSCPVQQISSQSSSTLSAL